ncbi:phage portal protein [Sphingomonas sp.]|uniref:phage portal protein n=1 Tax=Sphingomonas sp. TaxID=28214 RepID=UPI00375280F2
MMWFSRKSAAAPTAGFGVPEWLRANASDATPRSYEAMVREVFEINPVGQRSVRLVSSSVGALPVYSVTKNVAAEKLVMADGVLETIAAGLLLNGNAYVQMIPDDAGQPEELVVLRPDRVTVDFDRRGQPVGFVYRSQNGGASIPLIDALGRRQVAHIRAYHPLDDHYGLGCLGAAIAPAAVHNRAAKWNKSLLDNAARPSGAMIYDPGDGSVLSADQFARLKGELETLFSGAEAAGRPMVLDGGLKWQAMSMTPADMDFVALKEGAARDIALAFGVPPVLVGLPGDATYSNAREAGRALTRQTVLPMARRILGGLEVMLDHWFEADASVGLTVDVDVLSELAEDRVRLWDAVSKADFLTREEKRAMLGYETGTAA